MYDNRLDGRYLTIDHIPNEHLNGIGLVALSWAYLEGGVERIIWRLADLDDNDGIAVTTHLNMPMRLDMANSLIHLHISDPEFIKKFKKLAKHIKKTLSPLRNEIVHSRVLYLEQVKLAMRATYKSRGKVSKNMKPIEISEYGDASKDIMETANEVYNLLGHLDRAKKLRTPSQGKS